ncbi:hypothetical protein K435DRAFT_326664 [Dendrothele bispora CBS 962.96]|uniref:Uncharacterized protein n=1 Tax=Dendrothele bispora (strain CBS 962.96) TaxID=1314807 RepID=A0A4V4HDN2_DENBC|nr:hypothetical protein K435DRAFT_326664 [Dendrothele bispora CBS 962.96]
MRTSPSLEPSLQPQFHPQFLYPVLRSPCCLSNPDNPPQLLLVRSKACLGLLAPKTHKKDFVRVILFFFRFSPSGVLLIVWRISQCY